MNQGWASDLVRCWNEGSWDEVAAQLSPEVQVEAIVGKGGAPGELLLSGIGQFRAAYAAMGSGRRRFVLVSVLADDASASLVLRDHDGELLTVLVAFDGERRLRRVTSYRRSTSGATRAPRRDATPM